MMNTVVNTSELKDAGLHLRMLRLRAGLRQFEVAAQMGLHPGRLSEIECGRRKATPEQMETLLRVLEN